MFGPSVVAAILALALLPPLPAFAAGSTFLTGIVTENGTPAGGVTVTASGSNTNLQTRTDSRGRFSFGNLTSPFCKYTPHLTFDALKGVALNPNLTLTVRIGNIFNDRYLITYQNAEGNHYAAGRTFELGVRFGKGVPR